MKKTIGLKSRQTLLYLMVFVAIYLGNTTYHVLNEESSGNLLEIYFGYERGILLGIIVAITLLDLTKPKIMIETDAKHIYLNYRFRKVLIALSEIEDINYYLSKRSVGKHTARRVAQTYGTIRIHTKDASHSIGYVRSCEETVNLLKQEVRLATSKDSDAFAF